MNFSESLRGERLYITARSAPSSLLRCLSLSLPPSPSADAPLRLLIQQVLPFAKRIYGVPEFRLYAAADGIKQLLYNSQRGGLGSPLLRPGDQFLLLPFEI